MHLNYRQKENGMYILSRDDMDEIAKMILDKYMPQVLNNPVSVNTSYLAEEYYGLLIEKRNITKDKSILGLISFGPNKLSFYDKEMQPIEEYVDDGTMFIDLSLSEEQQRARYRFTITHELAHWLIHRSYHSATNQQYQLRKYNPKGFIAPKAPNYIACRSVNIEKGGRVSGEMNDSDWEEWQADNLAAAILMPKETFHWAALNALKYADVNGSYVYINGSNSINSKKKMMILDFVAKTYEVSYQAAHIRLEQLRYFRTVTRGILSY